MLYKNKYISENGHLKDEYISLYIDALFLDKVKNLPSKVTQHVEDCLLCKNHIIDGYDMIKEVTIINANEHPFFQSEGNNLKSFENSNLPSLYKIAASFIFIVCLSVIGYYIHYSLPQSSKTITSNKQNILNNHDSSTIKQQIAKGTVEKKESIQSNNTNKTEKTANYPAIKNGFAQNMERDNEFEVSPVIISMLGANTRSDFFKAIQPKDSTRFDKNQVIKFLWDSDITENIKLTIYNSMEELVFESPVLKSNGFDLNMELNHGAYIWKIEGSDDIYHLGLFYVNR